MDFGSKVFLGLLLVGIGLRQLGKIIAAKPVIGNAAAKGVADAIGRLFK